MPALTVRATIETWPFKHPFSITGYTFESWDLLVVEIGDGMHVGRGEGAGIYYLNDNAATGKAQIDAIADRLAAGITRNELIELLPIGAARNAVDAALWDLEAKQRGTSAWKIAGLESVRPLRTTYTIGVETPEKMADGARAFVNARSIKLKLDGTPEDVARVRAVRAARPDAWIGVDANQGFTRDSLAALMPALLETNVQLIEQPFKRGEEALFDGLHSPIPVAADESVLDLGDIAPLTGRVDVINIKLDKCGGLTRGLAMAAEAKRLGMRAMVGCMGGTSLAMAPGFVLGQFCDLVDLDGPTSLARDRSPAVIYAADGTVFSPEELWGSPAAIALRS
jgi:L-Ala-D/L-Glu epimerase